MKLTLPTVICVFLILATCSMPVLGTNDRKFDSFGAIDCEEEMARLDEFARELNNIPNARAYVFIYGGRRGTFRDEVRIRGARIKRYLIENRGLSPDRLEVAEGGHRESLSVDLFIISRDGSVPLAVPTVDPKTVRFKKGRMTRYREPGCFPGKYLNSTFHPPTDASK